MPRGPPAPRFRQAPRLARNDRSVFIATRYKESGKDLLAYEKTDVTDHFILLMAEVVNELPVAEDHKVAILAALGVERRQKSKPEAPPPLVERNADGTVPCKWEDHGAVWWCEAHGEYSTEAWSERPPEAPCPKASQPQKGLPGAA